MNIRSTTLFLGCLSMVVFQPVATAQGTVDARLKTQNALFEEYDQADFRDFPEKATAYGDYRYNDRLADRSLAAIERQHASDVAYLRRIEAVSTAGFSEQDILSHDLFRSILRQRLSDYALKEYEMPLNQMTGIHLYMSDLPRRVPLDSVKHYEDYIARLHQIPRVLSQTTEVLRQGMKDNLMPVRFVLEMVPGQCKGIIAANPFLQPTKSYPAGISAEDQKRLTAAITEAVDKEVLPAYSSFSDFIAKEYAPQGRTTLSVSSLPGGTQRYQNNLIALTTTTLTPDQIHAIGLKEVARINEEMTALAHKAGYVDLAAFRASMKSDPKWTPASSEQIVDDFRRYIAQMQPKLPQLFGSIPKNPVTVEALPSFRAADSTRYMLGTPDGKRPGRVLVATSDFAHRSLVEDESVAYHEGIPGHHMQISVQQQLMGLPGFRVHALFNAYSEGWGLYAEKLGKEVGFYQDPVSDYGRLNGERFRAVRLVVDTGIHAKGWTREQVVEYMRKNDTAEPLIQTEVDRYIAMPGQACGYKLGQLKIAELRVRAEKELGPKFDIRTFHDEILNGGSIPLDMLDHRMESWIQAQRSSGSVATAN